MPYCDTFSKPFFQTSVTSQALVAWSLHDMKALVAFPPTINHCLDLQSLREWTFQGISREMAMDEGGCTHRTRSSDEEVMAPLCGEQRLLRLRRLGSTCDNGRVESRPKTTNEVEMILYPRCQVDEGIIENQVASLQRIQSTSVAGG